MKFIPAAIVLCINFSVLGFPCIGRGAEPVTKLFMVHGAVNINAVPGWIAKEQGLFRKYGLDVDLVFVIGGRAAQAMIAGQAPLGLIGATHVSNAVTAGADLKMILGLSSTLDYVLVARPSIKSAKELRGKKVGIGTPAGPPSLAAYLALDHLGLNPQRDNIVLLQIGGVPERVAALRAGSVDATTITPALAQLITGQGYNILLDIGKENIPFHTTGLVTTLRLMRSNLQLVENTAKAIIEAGAYIHNPLNKKTVVQTLAMHLRLDKPDQLEKAYQDLLVELPRKPCPRIEAIASALRLMVQHGLNPKAAELKPEDVADISLCKKLDESGFMDRLYQQRK